MAEFTAVPVPVTSAPLTLAALFDQYMQQYQGRDSSRVQRLSVWRELLGERLVAQINDDDVFRALEIIASAPARTYRGRDIDGRPIFRAKGTRAPSTVNRYHTTLGAVFTWSVRRRIVPRNFENPCRRIPREREPAGRVRFLSEEERGRLLAACREAAWPRLYLLVLMAITTGARRGELLGLRWADIDRARAVAYVQTTKNNEPRVLPLVPAVLEEMARFSGAAGSLLFHARARPDRPHQFEPGWRTALSRSRIRSVRFHDLRHTCASYLAQHGASILEIADVLGHKQLAMSKRYSHLTVKSKAALVQRVLGEIK